MIIEGDCRFVLQTMDDASVDCVVTSPPYFGLRDYGVDGQIGLEDSLDLFIAEMVEVFREVRRVLTDRGTCWINLGDSYSHGGNGSRDPERWPKQSRNLGSVNALHAAAKHAKTNTGLKPKDLCGVPWRVAFALQADGWYLRQDIIWSKPNPMPESIKDRCTKAHEYVFMLSKSPKYFFDFEAIKEPRASQGGHNGVAGWASGDTKHDAISHSKDKGDARTFRGGQYVANNKFKNSHATGRDSVGNADAQSTTRLRRSVWTIAPQPFKEAHFATFPTALVEPCIMAGCPVDGVVLDPFGGAGTTGLVAQRLGRRYVLIELNPEYAEMARRRIDNDLPEFMR